jgi:hypothetical protein
MPPRRHSADLRGRRHDLGIGMRDRAAGLGIELARLLSMEDGTASEEDKILWRNAFNRARVGPNPTDVLDLRVWPRASWGAERAGSSGAIGYGAIVGSTATRCRTH